MPGATTDEPAVLPDGSAVYVTNRDDNSVSVIDTATNTVTATVLVGGQPNYALVLPDGSAIYVSDGEYGTVSVIGRS